MACITARSLRSTFSFGRASFGRVLTRSKRKYERKSVAYYYTKPKEKKGSGQAWLLLGSVTTAIAGGAVVVLGAPDAVIEGIEQGPDKYASDNVVKAYFMRAYDKIVGFKKSFSEPISEQLLPDPLPSGYQRPYTLVLSLKDLIVHVEYDRDKGWTYQKRPGTDALLVGLHDIYEIVVFTDEPAMSGHSICDGLDPNNLITYKLYRESTKYEGGQYIKDLSGLNRSLNRVIVVEVNKEAMKYQPENSIVLDKWTGDISDRGLWDLMRFLQTIALNDVADVRPILDYYKQQGEDKVLQTFKANQSKVQEEDEIRESYRRGQKSGSGVGRISRYHGSRSRHTPSMPVTPAEVQMSAVASSNGSTAGNTSSKHDSSNEVKVEDQNASQSWTEWIGSWIGWR